MITSKVNKKNEKIPLTTLLIGQVVREDIYKNNILLLAEGKTLTETSIKLLKRNGISDVII